jgi:plasmid stabilization system protein ParE
MPSLIVRPRARRQLQAAERWWVQHRDKAPEAFDEDVAAGLESIVTNPHIHQRVHGKPSMRRILLERVRYYIYYRIMATGDIEVLSVWHASRRPPRL